MISVNSDGTEVKVGDTQFIMVARDPHTGKASKVHGLYLHDDKVRSLKLFFFFNFFPFYLFFFSFFCFTSSLSIITPPLYSHLPPLTLPLTHTPTHTHTHPFKADERSILHPYIYPLPYVSSHSWPLILPSPVRFVPFLSILTLPRVQTNSNFNIYHSSPTLTPHLFPPLFSPLYPPPNFNIYLSFPTLTLHTPLLFFLFLRPKSSSLVVKNGWLSVSQKPQHPSQKPHQN